jgi:hypothetical protein
MGQRKHPGPAWFGRPGQAGLPARKGTAPLASVSGSPAACGRPFATGPPRTLRTPATTSLLPSGRPGCGAPGVSFGRRASAPERAVTGPQQTAVRSHSRDAAHESPRLTLVPDTNADMRIPSVFPAGNQRIWSADNAAANLPEEAERGATLVAHDKTRARDALPANDRALRIVRPMERAHERRAEDQSVPGAEFQCDSRRLTTPQNAERVVAAQGDACPDMRGYAPARIDPLLILEDKADPAVHQTRSGLDRRSAGSRLATLRRGPGGNT